VIPLFLVVNVGLCLSLLAFVYGIWIIVRYMLWASPIEGWSSLIVSISFTSGLILGSIGIVGLYVGKIYDEVKKRPLYIIDALTFDIGSEAATEPKCHIPARIPQSPEMG
jgi:dolichol-phosphate mannosyltransferase